MLTVVYVGSSVEEHERKMAAHRSADESTSSMTQRQQQATLLMRKINDVQQERNRTLQSLNRYSTLRSFQFCTQYAFVYTEAFSNILNTSLVKSFF